MRCDLCDNPATHFFESAPVNQPANLCELHAAEHRLRRNFAVVEALLAAYDRGGSASKKFEEIVITCSFPAEEDSIEFQRMADVSLHIFSSRVKFPAGMGSDHCVFWKMKGSELNSKYADLTDLLRWGAARFLAFGWSRTDAHTPSVERGDHPRSEK
jgi:hypothetical protein